MRHIFNYFNVKGLYKFASKEGFISRLRTMGARDEIISYVEGLEERLCGVVVGAVNKNKDISLDQLKELVAKKEKVEQLKKETAKEIEGDIAVEDERIKSWIIPQIKKDKKNRSLFLGNLGKINKFLSENDIDLGSYDLKSLLDYIDQVENFGSASGIGQDLVSQFLTKAMDYLNQKLLRINNEPLVNWARRKAIVICKEWERQIRKAMVEKPFEKLMTEAGKMKEDIDNGLYRGRELPNTPLRHGEYDSLVSNIEFLDDWHRNISPDLKEYSVDRAIAASNQWHREIADSGGGLQYEKIDRSNIVFGPDGWGSEENNGHFILELKSENDLRVEGAKMSHCVGGYGEKIKKGESRVFSLRNVNNVYQPILTIETDSSGAIVRQDYGPRNKKIDQKYHDMVTEWSSKNKNKIDISKIEIHDIYKIKNPDVLKEIASKTDDLDILWVVGKNPAANPDVFEVIVAKTDNVEILDSIAANKAANQNVLEAIAAKTEDSFVLESVASNPSANLAALEVVVAKTSNDNIRKLNLLNLVAKNPRVNQALFEAIIDKIDSIDIQLIKKEPLAQSIRGEALRSIAKNPSANQNVLEAVLAKAGGMQNILQLVTANPSANPDWLKEIVDKTNDNDIDVLLSIARNPAANQAVFEAIMAKTDNEYVIEKVKYGIEKLKENPVIANASHIDLIYKRACRFERASLIRTNLFHQLPFDKTN